MQYENIIQAAQYQWQTILPRVGIPESALRNQHQPCPLCGGKDRYRFDDKDGNGTYFCNQCGAGNGFTMLMKHLQCNFHEAACTVAQILGLSQSSQAITQKQPATPAQTTTRKSDAEQMQQERKRMMRIWQEASALNSESESYYTNRGLKQPATDAIRFDPKREYWTQSANGKAICLGAFPCLIAAVTNTQGEITGLHQTYLQHRANGLHKLVLSHPTTGEALPAKKMLGRVAGASVAIGANNDAGAIERDDYCLVAEGIESALAAQSLFHLTAYAALSANGLTQWIAPPQIKRVLIIADNDTPRPIGRQTAENLAKRLKANGLQCAIFEPPTHGHDALDFLHAIQANSSAIQRD